MIPLVIVFGIVLAIVGYIVLMYNGFVRLSTQMQEAWSQIDVQLKRRVELIPNLVESVKGYAKHEKDVFTDVTNARSSLLSAKTPNSTAAAENMLSGALKSLFAVAEAYPELKANENFLHLQKELSDTEDKVAYARQYYNTTVMEYNVKIKSFPGSLLAQQFKFQDKEFFEIGEVERQAPKVSFK